MLRYKKFHSLLPIVILAGFLTYLFVAYFPFDLYKKPVSQLVSKSSEKTTSKSATASPVLSEKVNVVLPTRIEIPKIKVNANIVYMGLTTAGDMESPTNIADAGWYKYGPKPGEKGSAVIAGHFGSGYWGDGVFINLYKIRIGDLIYIYNDNGTTSSFKVRKTLTFGDNERPEDVFNAKDGIHLNLVTCSGDWNRSQRSFSKRLVVFADVLN